MRAETRAPQMSAPHLQQRASGRRRSPRTMLSIVMATWIFMFKLIKVKYRRDLRSSIAPFSSQAPVVTCGWQLPCWAAGLPCRNFQHWPCVGEVASLGGEVAWLRGQGSGLGEVACACPGKLCPALWHPASSVPRQRLSRSVAARPLCRRLRGRGCANCQRLPQASPPALETTLLSCSPHQRHSAGVCREKGKGQKVPVTSRCCQGSLQDKTSQSFTTSFSIRKMSSTLKAASQASKGSVLSTLSTFTGSETKGCFPKDTQNPCWSQDGRKTGERGVSGRRKTPASLSEVGVPGVLPGPHHNHLSSSPLSMIT